MSTPTLINALMAELKALSFEEEAEEEAEQGVTGGAALRIPGPTKSRYVTPVSVVSEVRFADPYRIDEEGTP